MIEVLETGPCNAESCVCNTARRLVKLLEIKCLQIDTPPLEAYISSVLIKQFAVDEIYGANECKRTAANSPRDRFTCLACAGIGEEIEIIDSAIRIFAA